MKLSLLLSLLGLIALIAFAAAALKGKAKRDHVATRAKPLMTKREQAMYWRLREAFPDAVVLAQVSFSALITSDRKHRNRYDRKTADFVLCNPAMQPHAVIELDDASHKGRETNDMARDALLSQAGYTTIRFANVPDINDLRERVRERSTTEKSDKLRKIDAASPMAK